MKKGVVLLIVFLMSFVACSKDEPGLSNCLESKINEFKDGDYACAEGANVKEYLFKDKNVYVFDPGICGADMTSEVLDEDCNSLGYLGGIAGNSVIDGTNFNEAVFIRIIWER